ncbi:hypothetical protein C2845_PM03G29290 [Panicum miliaceum]|uniref:Uncharacterized protein n=1 Tax=Panicum miliaceum TaxID=4540 RepID=A0A3L6TAG2_PANMI|nr:hypothetical protein C2845_PM03G29290 [Panicum miliaceum]
MTLQSRFVLRKELLLRTLKGNNEEIDRKVSLIKAREEAQAVVALAAQTIAAGADEDTGEDEVEEEGNWEAIYPLATIQVVTRVGSDHNPLLLDSGEEARIRTNIFRFETS